MPREIVFREKHIVIHVQVIPSLVVAPSLTMGTNTIVQDPVVETVVDIDMVNNNIALS